MQTKILASSIEAGLLTTPSVVCGIIAEYAYERPHRWLPNDSENSVWKIEAKSESETEIKYVGPDRLNGRLLVWYRFASTETVQTGRLNWTIHARLDSFVRIGVTTIADNYVRYDGYSAPSPDVWIIRIDHNVIDICNDRKIISEQITKAFIQSPIHFAADPKTLQVTARLAMTDWNDIVLMTATSADEFAAIRPCVVLGETTSAALLS